MSYTVYNNAVRTSIYEDLPSPYRHIIDTVFNADHECSLLAIGSCSTCVRYLAFRYGCINAVVATHAEIDRARELALSFSTALKFIGNNHLDDKSKRVRNNQQQMLRVLPPLASSAPCTRDHLDDHHCPPVPSPVLAPCPRTHLDEHECAPCTEEHLSEHECPINVPDATGYVCYHLECLGECRHGPNSRVPQLNINPTAPGAFSSTSARLNALEDITNEIVTQTSISPISTQSTSTVQPFLTPASQPERSQSPVISEFDLDAPEPTMTTVAQPTVTATIATTSSGFTQIPTSVAIYVYECIRCSTHYTNEVPDICTTCQIPLGPEDYFAVNEQASPVINPTTLPTTTSQFAPLPDAPAFTFGSPIGSSSLPVFGSPTPSNTFGITLPRPARSRHVFGASPNQASSSRMTFNAAPSPFGFTVPQTQPAAYYHSDSD